MLIWVTGGCKGLQRVTKGYKALKRVTRGFQGVQRVTRGYRVKKGCRNIESFT